MTTTELTRIDAPAPFEPADIGQALALAGQLAQASLLPGHLRGKPADVLVTLLLGRDLGLTAMQAITGIHVIDGKPTVSAQTAVALVRRSPLCRSWRQVESTDERATYETMRAGEEPQRLTYTMADAQRAGLVGRGPWKAHPAAMLRARATMALARDVYPDVVANIYDPDELADQRADQRERVTDQIMRAPAPFGPPSSPPTSEARTISRSPAPSGHVPGGGETEPDPAAPQPAAATAQAPAQESTTLAGRLELEIAEAADLIALEALGKQIAAAVRAGAISLAERVQLRGHYEARAAELRAVAP